jgi:hypothetical protein
MDHLTGWGHQHASQAAQRATAERIVDAALATIRERLVVAVQQFLSASVTPAGFACFESLLLTLVRELGRILLQSILQSMESETRAERWTRRHNLAGVQPQLFRSGYGSHD